MRHFLKMIAVVALLSPQAQGQEVAYVKGHQWYGHEVDLCYLDFEKIRKQGDPQGIFAYAKLHLITMTQLEHGEPVYVLKHKIIEPDDIELVQIQRVNESNSFWTHAAALTKADPFAEQKLSAAAAREQAEHEKAKQSRERFKVQAKRMQLARAVAEDPHTRPPIALNRYWQIGKERFRGKLLNANKTHAKILESEGDTIIIDRRHLSETSNLYIDGMLHDLQVYREYQAMLKASVLKASVLKASVL